MGWFSIFSWVSSLQLFNVSYFPNGFPKPKLSKGIFPSGNFPTVQFPKRQLPRHLVIIVCLAVALDPLTIIGVKLGPHYSLSRLRGPNLIFWKLPLEKLLLGTLPCENTLTPSICRSHSDAVMLTSRPSIQQKASLDLDCIPEVKMSIVFVFVFVVVFTF